MVQTSLSAWLTKAKPKDVEHTVLASRDDGSRNSDAQELDTSVTNATQRQHHVEEESEGVEGARVGDAQLDNKDKSSGITRSRLPANATLAAITPETLPSFRSMTALLLPVPYPDKFFHDIIHDEITSSISMVALWSDDSATSTSRPRVVAGIRCRLIAHSPSRIIPIGDAIPSLYIGTIETLAPFRRHGLASALLRRITARAIREYGITTVTAHMWEANEEARDWYAKLGFKEMQFDPDYYRRLKPSGAYLLEKRIVPHDLFSEVED